MSFLHESSNVLGSSRQNKPWRRKLKEQLTLLAGGKTRIASEAKFVANLPQTVPASELSPGESVDPRTGLRVFKLCVPGLEGVAVHHVSPVRKFTSNDVEHIDRCLEAGASLGDALAGNGTLRLLIVTDSMILLADSSGALTRMLPLSTFDVVIIIKSDEEPGPAVLGIATSAGDVALQLPSADAAQDLLRVLQAATVCYRTTIAADPADSQEEQSERPLYVERPWETLRGLALGRVPTYTALDYNSLGTTRAALPFCSQYDQLHQQLSAAVDVHTASSLATLSKDGKDSKAVKEREARRRSKSVVVRKKRHLFGLLQAKAIQLGVALHTIPGFIKCSISVLIDLSRDASASTGSGVPMNAGDLVDTVAYLGAISEKVCGSNVIDSSEILSSVKYELLANSARPLQWPHEKLWARIKTRLLKKGVAKNEIILLLGEKIASADDIVDQKDDHAIRRMRIPGLFAEQPPLPPEMVASRAARDALGTRWTCPLGKRSLISARVRQLMSIPLPAKLVSDDDVRTQLLARMTVAAAEVPIHIPDNDSLASDSSTSECHSEGNLHEEREISDGDSDAGSDLNCACCIALPELRASHACPHNVLKLGHLQPPGVCHWSGHALRISDDAVVPPHLCENIHDNYVLRSRDVGFAYGHMLHAVASLQCTEVPLLNACSSASSTLECDYSTSLVCDMKAEMMCSSAYLDAMTAAVSRSVLELDPKGS